jgi:kynurenine formamidase
MDYIDLTLRIQKMNKVYKWAQTQNNRDLVMGHLGTHVDIYQSKTIPLEYMSTRGVLFDVSHITDREITLSDVDIDYIKPKDFILFRTGSIERNPYGSRHYFNKSTLLSWDLIKALVEEKIAFIGVDAPDIRKGKEHIEAEKWCEKYGVYIVENLVNLDQIDPFKTCKISTMWLEDEEATGLRCRVVALVAE